MVDLTDCDREPIHIPGTIQPFGVLFVLAEPALTVTQVSENVGDHLPLRVEDVLGQPLSTIMDPASVDEVREALREERWHDTNPLQHQRARKAIRRDRPPPRGRGDPRARAESRAPNTDRRCTTRSGRRCCGFNA